MDLASERASAPRTSIARATGFLAAVLLAAGILPQARPTLASPASDEGREARQELVDAINRKRVDDVKAALETVIQIGGRKNASTLINLLPRIPESEEEIYWTLVEGACSFRDRSAMQYIGETIVRTVQHPMARDLLYGLSRNTSPHLLLALEPILEDGPRDLQMLAVDKMAKIYSPKTVDLLIAQLKKLEEEIPNAIEDELVKEIGWALQHITGQRFGAFSVNWAGWWAKNRTRELGPSARDEEDDEYYGGTVVESLRRTRKEEFYALERAPKKGVIVLSAIYEDPVQRDLNNDHIESVLSRMGVPHTVVPRGEFEKFDLKDTGAIVINCAQFHEFCICPTCKPGGTKNNRLYRCTDCNKHIKFSARLSDGAIKKLVSFVKRGGYVFGEDWVIQEFIARAYPRYVRTGEVLRTGNGAYVDVVPARGMATHPYLRGIFQSDEIDLSDVEGEDEEEAGKKRRGGTVVDKPDDEESGDGAQADAKLLDLEHRWAIDDESWAFDVVSDRKVLELMKSGELQKKVAGQGVVAFAFSPGRDPSEIGHSTSRVRMRLRKMSEEDVKAGKPLPRRGRPTPGVVLQVLSHFGKQGSLRDEYLLQNILLNFLIDANVERQARNGVDVPGDEAE